MATNYEQFMAEADQLDPDGFARARAERAELAALRKDAAPCWPRREPPNML